MLSNRNFKRNYVKIAQLFLKNYMPRGLILAIDIFISLISALATYLLIVNIDSTSLSFLPIPWQLWVLVATQALFMVIFKSYAGIVRYSSLRDAAKQLQVVAFCILSLLFINQVYFVSAGNKLILNSGLLVYGVLTFCLLFIFRILVKSIYEIITRDATLTSALILGLTPDDVAMASGLVDQKRSKFSIIGFLDDQEKTMKNHIFGLPIYHIHRLKEDSLPAEAIIVSEEKLKKLQQHNTAVLTLLLDLNFKIYKLPTLQNFLDSNESGFNELRKINIEDLLQRTPIKLNTKELSCLYENKTILVTGAAGSIGSEIVRQLIPFKPKKILLVDQAETPLHDLSLELINRYNFKQYEKIIANVRNYTRMQLVFEEHKPQIVFHAAAYKHVPMMESNAMEAISVNFYGTRNVADLSVRNNVERFLLVSTDKAVNPTNIMGATKRSAELYIQYLSSKYNQTTTFVTTRFGNVLGSNGSVVPYFKKQIADGGPITVTHEKITRYFMTIDEACQLVLEAGAMANGGEIFVFDMGEPIKIIDLAHQMIKLSGLTPGKDIEIKITGLRPGEKLYEELLANEENTSKTHHEKILIGHATCQFTNEQLFELCNKLLLATENYNAGKALAILKKLVPEYHKPGEEPDDLNDEGLRKVHPS